MYKQSRACHEMTMKLKYFKIKNCILVVFRVAEFKSEAQKSKFKMADSIWQTDMKFSSEMCPSWHIYSQFSQNPDVRPI